MTEKIYGTVCYTIWFTIMVSGYRTPICIRIELTPEEAETLLHSVKIEVDNSEYIKLRLNEHTIEMKKLDIKMKFLELLTPDVIANNVADLIKLMNT